MYALILFGLGSNVSLKVHRFSSYQFLLRGLNQQNKVKNMYTYSLIHAFTHSFILLKQANNSVLRNKAVLNVVNIECG